MKSPSGFLEADNVGVVEATAHDLPVNAYNYIIIDKLIYFNQSLFD